MADTYTHPETGEKITIPPGSQIVQGEGGEISYWRNPPLHTGSQLHSDQIVSYEPTVDRLGGVRRVLGFITDEVDISATDENAQKFLVDKSALGPRNTVESITFAMARDPNSPHVPANMAEGGAVVQKALDKLVDEGLAKCTKAGVYSVTAAGRVELRN